MEVEFSREVIAPVRDEHAAHPVAKAWRPTFHAIVETFARGDFELASRFEGVVPVAPATATRIRDAIAAYGEDLAELPYETWRTSAAQWMGTYWEVLVDLWTVESGPSDLVLHAHVRALDGAVSIEVLLVYVP